MFNSLQKAGFKVLLADGKQTKMLKDKTDVKDARSIYHSVQKVSKISDWPNVRADRMLF